MYSKGLSHRNRLGGGSQSISKFSWEIEPTVSQFLNVHGKFSESRVSIGFGFYSSCALDKLVTSGAVLDACLRRSIDPRGDPGRYCTASHVCLTTRGVTLSNFSTLAVGTPSGAISCRAMYVPDLGARALYTQYTLSIPTISRFLFITLRVVSQFLYTTRKLEQKAVSRFLFLDF